MTEELQPDQTQNARLISMAEFDCGACKAKVRAKLPFMDVVNRMNYSAVFFTHEYPVQCDNCKSEYLPLLVGITKELVLKLVWKRVQRKPLEDTEVKTPKI